MPAHDPLKMIQKRQERIQNAIDLKEPDRVPMMGFAGDVVASYAGFTNHEVHYDFDKARQAAIKYLKDFPSEMSLAGLWGINNYVLAIAFADFPDLAQKLSTITGPIHDILKDKNTRFPGRELSDNSSSQFIGGTYMQPDEYDEYTADPIKFSYKKILPRISENIEHLNSPKAMATVAQMGMEIARQENDIKAMFEDLIQLGFTPPSMGYGYAPLDYIGDYLRDIPNLILDLRKYPDKVKAAAEATVEPIIKVAMASKTMGSPFAFFPLHLNEYLSPKLYKEFYWPTLKKIIIRLLDEGIKSHVFFEGCHEAHLETILELPRGWGIAAFEKTDVRKAKKMLAGHTCVSGGLKSSLVIGGTPEENDLYVKELLDEVKYGGGFILSPDVLTLPRDIPIENLKAVYQAVEKYGYY
jgi:uroporphyrinogen-III decarboxylase